jgi:transcription initiation factor TFIIIB Brf1 subunit/transcription initiation factor TFIIB
VDDQFRGRAVSTVFRELDALCSTTTLPRRSREELARLSGLIA